MRAWLAMMAAQVAMTTMGHSSGEGTASQKAAEEVSGLRRATGGWVQACGSQGGGGVEARRGCVPGGEGGALG